LSDAFANSLFLRGWLSGQNYKGCKIGSDLLCNGDQNDDIDVLIS